MASLLGTQITLIGPIKFRVTGESVVDGSLRLTLELEPCSQCGEPLTAWACGPTHAHLRDKAGLEWDGVEP